MKIRTDFVTNSSSSCYTITLQIANTDGVTVSFKGDISAEGGGYFVNLRINDGTRDLMSLDLFVSTSSEANRIKKNFYNNPELLYSVVLSAAIGEKNMIKETYKELLI